MIIIKHLLKNPTSTLNNMQRVDMVLNKYQNIPESVLVV